MRWSCTVLQFCYPLLHTVVCSRSMIHLFHGFHGVIFARQRLVWTASLWKCVQCDLFRKCLSVCFAFAQRCVLCMHFRVAVCCLFRRLCVKRHCSVFSTQSAAHPVIRFAFLRFFFLFRSLACPSSVAPYCTLLARLAFSSQHFASLHFLSPLNPNSNITNLR